MYLQCVHVNKLNIYMYMQTLHPGVKVYLLCVHMFLKTLGQNSSWILHARTAILRLHVSEIHMDADFSYTCMQNVHTVNKSAHVKGVWI